MGPLRGGLILSLLAGPVGAEVCDKVRPNWDGTPASALSEAVALFGSPLGLFLLIATAFAIRFRHAWAGLATVIGWTGFVSIILAKDPTGIHEFAVLEGCVGPPTLFVGVTIAICIGTILYTAPRRLGKTDGDSDA